MNLDEEPVTGISFSFPNSTHIFTDPPLAAGEVQQYVPMPAVCVMPSISSNAGGGEPSDRFIAGDAGTPVGIAVETQAVKIPVNKMNKGGRIFLRSIKVCSKYRPRSTRRAPVRAVTMSNYI